MIWIDIKRLQHFLFRLPKNNKHTVEIWKEQKSCQRFKTNNAAVNKFQISFLEFKKIPISFLSRCSSGEFSPFPVNTFQTRVVDYSNHIRIVPFWSREQKNFSEFITLGSGVLHSSLNLKVKFSKLPLWIPRVLASILMFNSHEEP